MNKNNSNFFNSNNGKKFIEENFFLQQSNIVKKPDFVKTQRHLNDYDLNLLEENAYKDMPDTTFRLEYEISKIEDELKNIGTKMLAAKAIRNTEEQILLLEQKAYLESCYDSLVKQYNSRGLSAKLSDYISYMFGNSNYANSKKGILNQIISKLPKTFKKIAEIEASLHNLQNINKSSDKHFNSAITSSEGFGKYSQLSKYITKANSLQSEIENFIKNQK